MNQIDFNAMMQVKGGYQHKRLTKQQFKTLRGQVLAGNGDAAMRGLRKILSRMECST